MLHIVIILLQNILFYPKVSSSPVAFTLEMSQYMEIVQGLSHIFATCESEVIWCIQAFHQTWGGKEVIPTPRTIFIHSSSKIKGSLRTSLPLSKVRIPFRDWTTMDWTVMLTWKTNSYHFWILSVIIFGFFCIIIFVTVQGSVPQGEQSIILWTTAMLGVLLKFNKKFYF